jgi:hypothetical protein
MWFWNVGLPGRPFRTKASLEDEEIYLSSAILRKRAAEVPVLKDIRCSADGREYPFKCLVKNSVDMKTELLASAGFPRFLCQVII